MDVDEENLASASASASASGSSGTGVCELRRLALCSFFQKENNHKGESSYGR